MWYNIMLYDNSKIRKVTSNGQVYTDQRPHAKGCKLATYY